MNLASIGTLLERFTSAPELELEWVDLLSQMEYVGFRKIAKAVPYDAVTLDTLRHVSEESSHAFLLKAAAQKNGLPPRSWRDGLLSAAGWAYFQGLDRGVEAAVPDPALCYPLVAVAVERRVLELYPAYLERARIPDVRKAVERILVQERAHARLFDERALPPSAVEAACRIEERLWEGFVSAALRLAEAYGTSQSR
jgi:hypothetical protein